MNWQPIETGPEGEAVLLTGDFWWKSKMIVGIRFGNNWYKKRRYWNDEPLNEGKDIIENPTYWMPLPELPK